MMSFLDAADLPRAIFLRDTSRRYRGLSYNCSHAPAVPTSLAPPPRRDSAVGTSLLFTKSSTIQPTPRITLTPLTPPSIPSALALHASSLANDPKQAQDLRPHDLTLLLSHPSARTIKASSNGTLIGLAIFLPHELHASQLTTTAQQPSSSSVLNPLPDRLAAARDEVLDGDHDVWHIHLVSIAPKYRNTSAWNDMVSWGLSMADEAGKRVYVQASPVEKGMYEQLGFEMKRVVELPMEGNEGGSGDECLRYLLLRPAKV